MLNDDQAIPEILGNLLSAHILVVLCLDLYSNGCQSGVFGDAVSTCR